MQAIEAMEAISVFDILKVGVGPSSSHTLGPWRAAENFIKELEGQDLMSKVSKVTVSLYGSLALTGSGHGTDKAVMLGLSGEKVETIDQEELKQLPERVKQDKKLMLAGKQEITFSPIEDIIFQKSKKLPFHSNALTFIAKGKTGFKLLSSTYYSVGGGFILHESEIREKDLLEKTNMHVLPFPAVNAADILNNCADGKTISQMVMANELTWRSKEEVYKGLDKIWEVMLSSVYKGCHTEGKLPGGLDVKRRAFDLNKKLMGNKQYKSSAEWIGLIKKKRYDFSEIIKWIGCFAMAVNEENANYGRIVTAPTNGSAGVLPAVLLYYLCFSRKETSKEDIYNFLLTSGEIGSLFKKGSTLSAAMGGCQAEIGVSSAMAAAALTEVMGGELEQVLMAAEIAMEHHLGLTCDPIGGLVQVPCIERNCMGAVKAITASKIALDSDPAEAKVSLDNVIKTMWETARDMNSKYKETSLGGLATNISVKISEC